MHVSFGLAKCVRHCRTSGFEEKCKVNYVVLCIVCL
jgi:hypothetical protein